MYMAMGQLRRESGGAPSAGDKMPTYAVTTPRRVDTYHFGRRFNTHKRIDKLHTRPPATCRVAIDVCGHLDEERKAKTPPTPL